MNTSAELSHEAALRWVSCAASDVGHMRKANEDSFMDAREQGLWVVADGMGGHSRGDLASQTIIKHLITFEASASAEDSVTDLRNRIKEANLDCRRLGRGEVVGSTVVAMFNQGPMCYFLWAGDSRVYRLRDDKLEQITEDHSLVQELCKLGEITAEEAESHPSSNVITRAVGVQDQVQVDVLEAPVKPGDRFLICSDGLFRDVAMDEVKAKLANPTPQQALRDLVQQALDRGGSDNITAIVVQASHS